MFGMCMTFEHVVDIIDIVERTMMMLFHNNGRPNTKTDWRNVTYK